MAKIRTSNTTKGRPPFQVVTPAGPRGGLVDKTKAGRFSGTRTEIARDPSKAITQDRLVNPIIGAEFVAGTQAVLTTALVGANNDLVFTAVKVGTVGNAITVAYVDPGAASQALGVVVAGNAITVNLATDAGSLITSTASEILAALEASAAAMALISVALAAGNDGTGVVTALVATALATGTNATTPADGSVNIEGAPTPGTKSDAKSRRASVPAGQEKVVDRSKNRRVRVTKY